MNIILIGFKSCGKSSTGRELAYQMGMSFVDTDTLLEQRYALQHNPPLSFREIYRTHGRDYFLELERQVVQDIGTFDECIIAVGGGTFVNHPITDAIRTRATIIYLDVAPHILLGRIERGGVPAFFDNADFQQEFLQLFHERDPIYRQVAHICLDVSHCTAEESARLVLKTIKLQHAK